MLRVLVQKGLVDRRALGDVQQRRAELRTTQQARDASERLQMCACRVLRDEENEEQPYWFLIDRVEGYAVSRPREAGDEVLDAGDLGVGDRDAVADAGRPEALARHQ